MKNLLIGILLSLIFVQTAVFAQSNLELGYPGYAGSGCPVGSASVTLSPDNTSLSLLFDNYVAQAGAATGLSMDRKNCNISIPVLVPSGYSVSIITVDYRGFTSIPIGGSGRFSAEYFFAGSRGPIASRNFIPGREENFTITNRLGVEAMVWSTCGADVNLRVNTNMLVRSNRFLDDAMGVVDSADFQTGIIFHMQIRRC